MRARPAVSLIEMEVALLILAIGLLSAMPLAARSLGRVREAALIDRSSAEAVAILDSLTQLEHPGAGSSSHSGLDFDWVTTPAGASIGIELHVQVVGAPWLADSLLAVTARWPARLHRVP
jgi:type II secretory pathway pseudopilin PulG